MHLLLELFFRISNQVQKTAAVPEDSPHIPSVHPRQPAGDAANQRIPLLVLLCQLIFRAVHIMGKLQPRPVSFPVDNPVLNSECPLQNRVLELPLVKFILGYFAVGTERAGTRPSLDYFITLTPRRFHRQYLAGMLVHIQQLIGVHIADICIALVCIQHKMEILQLLPVEPFQFLFPGSQGIHSRKLCLQYLPAR